MRLADGMSSKPTTDTSCGTRNLSSLAASIMPIANRSLAARIAVGRGRIARRLSAATLPSSSMLQGHSQIRKGKLRSVAPQDVKISLNSAPAQFEAAAREMLRFDKSSISDAIQPKTHDSKSSVTKRSEMLRGGSRRGAIVNPHKRDV